MFCSFARLYAKLPQPRERERSGLFLVFESICNHGRRQLVGNGGQGAVAPLDFHTWHRYTVVERGLIVIFFGLFCYFSVFFFRFSPSENFSADAFVCNLLPPI